MNPAATEPFDRLGRQAVERCHALASFSEEPGRMTRTFLSPPMRPTHDVVRGWMEAAGLSVRVDALGNIVGRREADRPGAPALLVGSHLDTVPNGGIYDGILGVTMGLALAEALRDDALPFALEVIGFSEEEGVRFKKPFLGSAAVAGCFDPAWLDRVDAVGITLRGAIANFGLDPTAWETCRRAPGEVLGFIEAHIEQGPVLEALNCPVGVVDAIVGQTRLFMRLEGRAGHAGTTPMNARRDAAAGAAQLVALAERIGSATPALVATVGSLSIEPNAPNVIAGRAFLTLDVRHASNATRGRAVEEFEAEAARLAAERHLVFEVMTRASQESAPMDPALTGALSAAAAELALPAPRMTSGAGHDAMIMAPAFPTALVFIRCREGLSHHPDEHTEAADVAAGLAVMTGAVRTLAASRRG